MTDPDPTATRAAADPFALFVDVHRRSLPAARADRRFNAGEHVWLGGRGAAQACRALAAAGAPDFSERFAAIPRAKGRDKLDYGELVALSGDFYETPSSLFDEKPSAVPWLWESNDLSDLRALFEGELRWIEERHKGAGGTQYPDYNVRLAWNAKAYVELALRNTDHFGWHNVQAYCRHHAEALKLALDARGKPDETFRRALYTNAFADHFLTDGFAAGHIRVPRAEIRGWAAEKGWGEKLAGALSKVLHDQDGHVDASSLHGVVDENARAANDGLHVRNARGASWYTRCDGQLFLDRGAVDSEAVKQAVDAVAASVGELLVAWTRRDLPRGVFAATELVAFPHPDEPALAAKFPADAPAAVLDALFESVQWYAKIPWIGPGLGRDHLKALFAALPDLMARFRANVGADADRDAELTRRIAPEYVAAFREIA